MEEYRLETDALLRLLRAVLLPKDDPIGWEEGCSVSDLALMIAEQRLVPMLYSAIQRQTGPNWECLAQQLKPLYQRELHRGLMQEYEIQALLDDMERDSIDCLPMKGWVMRDYYSDPLMRSMGDFDVLIRDMDSRKMQKWMEAHGYTPEHTEQEVEDIYMKPPYMNIELHRRLIEAGRLKQQHTVWRENCLVSLWRKEYLQKEKKHIYRLSDEDFLVYQLLHFYKHFTNSGVGIRPLADLYLFLQAKRYTMDQEYIKRQLDALHISAFCKQMTKLMLQCFEAQKWDESGRIIVDYLVRTGIYGDLATIETACLFREKGKNMAQTRWHSFWRQCFPPVDVMKNRYLRLNDMPCLLPFYWAIRIGRVVFLEPHKLAAKLATIQKYQTQDRYDCLQRIYQAAGVLEEASQ